MVGGNVDVCVAAFLASLGIVAARENPSSFHLCIHTDGTYPGSLVKGDMAYHFALRNGRNSDSQHLAIFLKVHESIGAPGKIHAADDRDSQPSKSRKGWSSSFGRCRMKSKPRPPAAPFGPQACRPMLSLPPCLESEVFIEFPRPAAAQLQRRAHIRYMSVVARSRRL
jgi:hypothetical protein